MNAHSRKRTTRLWVTLPIAMAALGLGGLSIMAGTVSGEQTPIASSVQSRAVQMQAVPELPALDANARHDEDHPATF